jgi:hypothetical protein
MNPFSIKKNLYFMLFFKKEVIYESKFARWPGGVY